MLVTFPLGGFARAARTLASAGRRVRTPEETESSDRAARRKEETASSKGADDGDFGQQYREPSADIDPSEKRPRKQSAAFVVDPSVVPEALKKFIPVSPESVEAKRQRRISINVRPGVPTNLTRNLFEQVRATASSPLYALSRTKRKKLDGNLTSSSSTAITAGPASASVANDSLLLPSPSSPSSTSSTSSSSLSASTSLSTAASSSSSSSSSLSSSAHQQSLANDASSNSRAIGGHGQSLALGVSSKGSAADDSNRQNRILFPQASRNGLPWTEEEDQRLLRCFKESKGDWARLHALFPDRGWRALRSRLRFKFKLDVKMPREEYIKQTSTAPIVTAQNAAMDVLLRSVVRVDAPTFARAPDPRTWRRERLIMTQSSAGTKILKELGEHPTQIEAAKKLQNMTVKPRLRDHSSDEVRRSQDPTRPTGIDFVPKQKQSGETSRSKRRRGSGGGDKSERAR